MSHNVKIRAEWRVEVVGANGVVKQTVDWTKNTITVQGFNVWGTDRKGLLYSSTSSDMQIHKMGFGSSATPALWTDISLKSEVYSTTIDGTLSSSAIDVVDPTAPFIILGASIASGVGPFTINEIGLYAYSSGVYTLFNRIVLPVTISKLENDTLNAQCKITLEYIYDDTPEVIDVRYLGGTHYTYSTSTTVILAPGIQRLFMNNWLNAGTEEIHIGSSSQQASINDTDVVTEVEAGLTTGTVSCAGSAVSSGGILDYYKLAIEGVLYQVPASTTLREYALCSDGLGFRTVLGANMTTRPYYTTDMIFYWELRLTQ